MTTPRTTPDAISAVPTPNVTSRLGKTAKAILNRLARSTSAQVLSALLAASPIATQACSSSGGEVGFTSSAPEANVEGKKVESIIVKCGGPIAAAIVSDKTSLMVIPSTDGPNKQLPIQLDADEGLVVGVCATMIRPGQDDTITFESKGNGTFSVVRLPAPIADIFDASGALTARGKAFLEETARQVLKDRGASDGIAMNKYTGNDCPQIGEITDSGEVCGENTTFASMDQSASEEQDLAGTVGVYVFTAYNGAHTAGTSGY